MLTMVLYNSENTKLYLWERSGSVVECLTRDGRASGLEPHQRHCVMSLSKAGSTQEDLS